MEIQKEMDAAEETISSLTSDKERLSQEVLQAQKEMLALVEQAKVGDSAKSQLTSVEEALKTSNEQLLEATVSHRFSRLQIFRFWFRFFYCPVQELGSWTGTRRNW